MRVLAACSLGGAGHLNPLLPFLAAARRGGHETLVVGPPALGPMVQLAGYRFGAGGEPPEEVVAPIRERLPVAPRAEASALGNRDLFGRLATGAMLPEMERICAEWLPHLVLREPCEYASAVVAGAAGIPTGQVAISLAEAEAGSIAVAAPALEVHRRGLVDELWASPYVTRFPPSLDPSPFPRTVRVRDARAVSDRPLPNWWNGSRAPLVYVSFGTVLGYMSVAGSVYRTLLMAVKDLDARVLLTVGRRFDASGLGPIPGNVHVEDWVDQVDVMQEAGLVVCHGGSGTALGALAAAVPMVIVPVFADQFENGRRVADAGAGLVVGAAPATDGTNRSVIGPADAARITDAIETVLGTPSYRGRATLISAEMAGAPVVDDVLAALLAGSLTGLSPAD
jgi:UDP:flavonoid glycosyltransferase YjiC (YdhE family)